MENCSIALQILPQYTNQEVTLKVVDRVISYLKSHCKQVEVSAFETTIIGEYDEMMAVLKGAIELAGEYYPRLFANIKISYNHGGSVLGIEDKVSKHRTE